jgi:hypothetical protein
MRHECKGEQEKLSSGRLPMRKDIEYEINGEQGRDEHVTVMKNLCRAKMSTAATSHRGKHIC